MPSDQIDLKEQDRLARIAWVHEEIDMSAKEDPLFNRYFGSETGDDGAIEILEFTVEGSDDNLGPKRPKKPRRYSKMRERRRIRNRARRAAESRAAGREGDTPPAHKGQSLVPTETNGPRRVHRRHAQHRNNLRIA